MRRADYVLDDGSNDGSNVRLHGKDPQTIPFLEEFFKHEFEKLRQECKVNYAWDKGSGDIVFSCVEPEMEKEKWENSLKVLKSYIDQIVTEHKIMSKENWKVMYVKAKKTFAVFETKIQIFITENFNKKEIDIALTGKRTDVFELLKQLKDIEEHTKRDTDFLHSLKNDFAAKLKKVEDAISRKKDVDLIVKRCDQFSTRMIEESVMDKLRKESPFHINEISWNQTIDDGKQPVLVFCVISSRIGVNIENAMSGVHDNTTVVLVLLHLILRNTLQGDLSDDEELLDLALKTKISAIAHFAYSANEGLYSCPQNKTGHQTLLKSVTPLLQSAIRQDLGYSKK